MKIYIIIAAIFFSCSIRSRNIIRKVPCENIFTYNNAGTLNGTYLTLYYAVDYLDTVPLKKIRYCVDTVLKKIDTTKYSGFICWFLKESTELKKIKNCDITDSHNISSDEHKAIILFMYDTKKKSLQEINYDENGNLVFPKISRIGAVTRIGKTTIKQFPTGADCYDITKISFNCFYATILKLST